MNALIRSLARICKAYPLQEKILIVPDYQAGQEILKSLSLLVGSWTYLKVTTVNGMALDIVAADLCRREIRLINDNLSATIVQKAVSELQEAGELEYFKELELTGSILSILTSSLSELKRAGVSPDSINPDDFVSSAKGRDIKKILTQYQYHLSQQNIIDMAGVFELAISMVSGSNNPLYLLPASVDLDPLEDKLLSKVSNGKLITLPTSFVFGMDNPNEMSSELTANVQDTNYSAFSWLHDPANAPVNTEDNLSLFSSYGITNEVKEVLRRVLAYKLPLDEVQIICTVEKEYIHAFMIECGKLGIPITFSAGTPISFAGVGRVLAGLIDWIRQDFNVNYLREILESGDVSLELGSWRVARILRRAGIGWGRERYGPCLDTLALGYKERMAIVNSDLELDRLERYQKRLCEIINVKDEMEWVFSKLPIPNSERKIEVYKLAKGLADILSRWKKICSQADTLAYSKIIEGLHEYKACVGLELPLEGALTKIYEWLNSISIQPSASKPGHIHVVSYRRAGWTSRKHSFVVGLASKFFPGAGIQDPILLDKERSKISKFLQIYSNRPKENIYQMSRILASLSGRITLSYPAFDTVECRRLFPSTIILQAFRLMERDDMKDYSDLEKKLGVPIGFVVSSEHILDHHDWWISTLYPTLKADGIKQEVLQCYPYLAQGINALTERSGNSLTAFDGKIDDIFDHFDPRKNTDIVMSCSKIEAIAKCPYGYYLKHILGIEAPEDVLYDANQWLDALARGSLLHDVYYRFMSTITEKSEKPQYIEHIDLLNEIMNEVINEYKDRIPPPNEIVYKWECGKIQQACDIFLRVEAQTSDATPKYFELPFGMEKDSDILGSLASEPVRIELANGQYFYLRGKVDRIDEVEAQKYRIWDYKTGSSYGYDEIGFIKGGRQLQHALYSMAVQQLLQATTAKEVEVELAGYLFHSERGEGQRIVRLQNRNDDVINALNTLFDIIATGTFHSTDDGNDCRFCEYQVICADMPGFLKTKLEDEENNSLKLWKELKSYD